METVIMGRFDIKLNVFKNMALELATLSHDPKHKVACIIIPDTFRSICAIGYNGNYIGGPNERDSMESGKSGFLHAEENCLFSLSTPYELRSNLMLICTLKPCTMCAKRIVNSGIKRVYYVEDYAEKDGQTDYIFSMSKVSITKI